MREIQQTKRIHKQKVGYQQASCFDEILKLSYGELRSLEGDSFIRAILLHISYIIHNEALGDIECLEMIEKCILQAKNMARSSAPCDPELRKLTYRIFDMKCEYCGITTVLAKANDATAKNAATIDRIIPGIWNGRYRPENITLACRTCNIRKWSGEFIGPVRSLAVMLARSCDA